MTFEDVSCTLACQDLMVGYFTALDSGDRSKVADLFADDGKMDSPRGGAISGAAAIRERLSALPREFVPVHLAANLRVSATGPDTADGSAYVVAYNMIGKLDDTLPRPMPANPSRIGTVDFKFRRTAAGWRISLFKPNVAFIDDGKT